MRTLLELYKLLLEHFKKIDLKSSFYICNEITGLYENNVITKDEFKLLKGHFETQKPSPDKHSDFYEHELFVGTTVWFSTIRKPELSFSLRVQLLTNIIAELKQCQ